MHVEFRVLGPLELRLRGAAVPLRGPKLRALLADLLVNRGEVVPTDRLVDDLWPGGAPKGARHAIETHISKLRTAVGDAASVAMRPPGYVLEVEPGAVDAVRFEVLLAEARDADPERMSARLLDALALWRGPAYADVGYEPFAQAEIARLEELRLQAEEEHVDAELALGRLDPGAVEALVAAHPLRERRRAQLMLAHYRAGRQADALAVFRSARELLLEELGIEPSEQLRDLHRAILRQDTALTESRASAAEAAPRMTRRRIAVLAVEPAISLDLDPEEHARQTQRASDAVRSIATDHAAQQPEPFVLVFPQEDQLERAAAAADAVRAALDAHTAVESGEALVGAGEVRGPVIERARARARDGSKEPEPHAPRLERRIDAPFVGRDAELELLRRTRAAVVLGPPGIGKSRLAHELARDRVAAIGRCSSYAAESMAPLHQIAAALGSSGALESVLAGEVPLRFRRICESAEQRPLVILDDMHWADPLVIDTFTHLVEHGDSEIQVLCLAREEVLEDRPALLPRAERVVLQPLSLHEAERLAAQIADVDGDVLERALAAAEGNPLFIEQLVAHATDGAETVPATLQALLAARLDRLSQSERAAVDRAAVIGRDFDGALVGDLLGASSARGPLVALVRRGLIDPAAPTAAFEERFRFRHALIHEVAYAAVPRGERSRTHEQVADALDARRASDEVVGFHLERAAKLRPERDRHGRRLAEDAGRRLGAAGVESWKRGDTASTGLLERAVALLPANDEQRRDLLCELAIAHHGAGDVARANEVLREAEGLGDRRIQLRAQIEQASLALIESPRDAAARLLDLAAAAEPVFEAVGDERSLGRAWMLVAWVRGGVYCRHADSVVAAERALGHYRRAGWASATCVAQIAAAQYRGPTPVPDAIGRCEKLLEDELAGLAGDANVYAHLGGLHAMRGDAGEAAALLRRSRALYADLGRAAALVYTCAPIEAVAARLRGDPDSAAEILRRSCEELVARGSWFHLVTQAAELADVLSELSRHDEAETWCALAETHAPVEDLGAQVSCRIARARLLRAAGRPGDAEGVAREAVALAASTDELNLRAAAHVALAGTLEGAAREQELDAAAALFEEKGNAAAADRLRRGRAAAASSAPA